MDHEEWLRDSETFVDSVFGDGQGEKHTEYLRFIENDALREMIHRYHAIESDTTHLSLAENYLIGMSVLCALKSWGPVAMFAKTLRHLGVTEAKILEATARLSMWIGGIPAAEATAHVQRALREYREKGAASLQAWFPETDGRRRAGGADRG
jgi:alkylhydroperoxidase/carboxymuconolactone decarboxylase family protein YurZ